MLVVIDTFLGKRKRWVPVSCRIFFRGPSATTANIVVGLPLPTRTIKGSALARFSRSFSSRQDPSMVSVNSPQPHRAFIALGSNMGDRIGVIEKACLELERMRIQVKRTSSLFETAPMYVLDQDPFLNGVCEVSFTSV